MYEHLVKGRASEVRRIARNDNSCGWIETLPPRGDIRRMARDIRADWAVIGAGYAGLAAARRLAELFPGKEIALVEAQHAGECSAGRNSGFAVEASPGRVGDDESMRAKARVNYLINIEGLSCLRRAVLEHGIDCAWDDSGKFHCAAEARNEASLDKFTGILDELAVPYEWLDGERLRERLGIGYYRKGLWTRQGVLVQPAALARGLALTLPANVRLFEETPVERISYGDRVRIDCRGGTVTADNVFVATNGLLGEFGLFRGRMMHLTLTASLTRPLTAEERAAIGDPAPWGVLSAHRMGATVRYTADRRIMMRNTAEYWPRLEMTPHDLQGRRDTHLKAIRARWSMLPDLEIEHTWSGVVAVSRNFSSVFARPAPNVCAVGGFNAGGIARGSGLGKLMVDMVAGVDSEALRAARGLAAPSILPPRPFLDLAARVKVAGMKAGVGRE